MSTADLCVRIIPCLDVTDGRVVKGVNFLNLRDAGDPVKLAAFYNREGADELVFYDITASSDHRKTMLDVVRATADQVFIPLAVGGGVRSVEDMRQLLACGADKVSVNTAALQRPQLINECSAMFGAQCVVVGIDARQRRDGSGWDVFIHGGRTPTGIDVIAWAEEVEQRGAGEIVLNSMDRDGTKSGYDLALLEAMSRVVNLPIVASGGAGATEHFAQALQPGRADAVLAASLFHFGDMRIHDLKASLRETGLPVRMDAGG